MSELHLETMKSIEAVAKRGDKYNGGVPGAPNRFDSDARSRSHLLSDELGQAQIEVGLSGMVGWFGGIRSRRSANRSYWILQSTDGLSLVRWMLDTTNEGLYVSEHRIERALPSPVLYEYRRDEAQLIIEEMHGLLDRFTPQVQVSRVALRGWSEDEMPPNL